MTTKEYLNSTNEEEKSQFNRELCEKYPWLIPTNRWTGEVVEDYDYDYTELDSMPDGWRIAFGDQMVEELNQELVKGGFVNDYRITQIKEKYGGLRWYDNGNTKEGYNIINKYESLSRRTCICCGKPAKYITFGWISPFCEDCIKDIEDDYETVEEYFGEK